MDIKTKQKEYRKKCLEIVEKVLSDEVIETKAFLENCLYISRNDYNDICIERSLTDLCGYALCPNRLSSAGALPKFKPKQKYKIDSKNNRIFEIEVRKQFCSNLCYNSSNYLREQMSEEPIYMRPKSAESADRKPIQLYSNRGVGRVGEEVLFDRQLIDDCKSRPKDKNVLFKQKDLIGFPYIREEYLDQLKDQMKSLSVSERNGSKDESNGTKDESNGTKDESNGTKDESNGTKDESNGTKDESNGTKDESNGTKDESNGTKDESNGTDERTDSDQKAVPVITESLKSDDSRKSKVDPKPNVSPKCKLECVESVLKDWITSSTHEFIFGVKKEINFESIRRSDESVDFDDEEKRKKLSEMRFNYMTLCAKLDLDEKRDQLIDDVMLGKAKNGKSAEQYANEDNVSVYNDDFAAIFDAFRNGKQFRIRDKKVTFNRKDGSVAPIESLESTTSDHLFVPPTGSEFIRRKRLEIVLSSVENALNVLFDWKYLTDLRSDIKNLIKTFRLSASNVGLNEDSLLMSLFLIRMLIIGKKALDLDILFDEKPISKLLDDFGLNKSDIDRKIESYFQI